jgi:hypothetical protein
VANVVGFFTGLAFYNLGDQKAEITVKVYSSEGIVTGEEIFELEPGRRFSGLVPELVPSTAGQVKGYIEVISTQPLIAQQLFGDSRLNLLSAVPPTVVR